MSQENIPLLVCVGLNPDCRNSPNEPPKYYFQIKPYEFVMFRMERIREFFSDYISPDRSLILWLSIEPETTDLAYTTINRQKSVRPNVPFSVVYDWFIGEKIVDRKAHAVELMFNVGHYQRSNAYAQTPAEVLKDIYATYLEPIVNEQQLLEADSLAFKNLETAAANLWESGKAEETSQLIASSVREIVKRSAFNSIFVRAYVRKSLVVETLKVDDNPTVEEFIFKHRKLLNLEIEDRSEPLDVEVLCSGIGLSLSFKLKEVAELLGFGGILVDIVIK